jgi:hypothetical protein
MEGDIHKYVDMQVEDGLILTDTNMQTGKYAAIQWTVKDVSKAHLMSN